jgi:hypothetical protein
MPFFPFSSWNIGRVELPWGGRPSIFRHLEAHIRPHEAGLAEDGDILPDEDRVVRGAGGLRWAPGALDGAWGHHGGGATVEEIAHGVLEALRAMTNSATRKHAGALYAVLTEHAALEYIDPLLEQVIADKQLDHGRLHAIALWLATQAADREPVKVGIGLLGLFRAKEDRHILLILGRHEEFTLYVAVALANTDENPEHVLWELAQHVTGWGRIHIVERLAKTKDEQIKAWLLRQGYRNDIMFEYTALICATTGDLITALHSPQPDDALLAGAGDILAALIAGRGGPASGIGEYPDGAEAAELYLTHLQDRRGNLETFLTVYKIRRFLDEDEGEATDPELGWLVRKDKLVAIADAFLRRPDWAEQVRAGLRSGDSSTFFTAAEAGPALGIDIWPVHFERLASGEMSAWYWANGMRTDDPERINRVVELAEERLPLAEIAIGPAGELGIGREFAPHQALDSVLQELGRFPGRGWPLIRAGLASPVTRNRNMAVRALGAWTRSEWPAEAHALLARALEHEPNEDTRKAMQELLVGERAD